MTDNESDACEYVAQPCRNFNILGHTAIIDPWDGKEKFVLSNFALGGTGTIIFIDTETGVGESFTLPVGNGAWGIVNWRDEKLVIGTCVDQAYLHVFDLRSRTWAEPLPSPREAYFWKMTLGSDGNVYGGTYPGCSLMQYDPRTHTLVNLGKVSDNGKNLYSRPVWGEAPGYIFVSYGYDTTGLKAYRIATGEFLPIGGPGTTIRAITDEYVCTETDGALSFYDPLTLAPLDGAGLAEKLVPPPAVALPNGQKVTALRLASGKLAGVRGQDFFLADAPGDGAADGGAPVTVELKRIPAEAPDTEIFMLIPDRLGRLWGASGFGQTIFRFDPATGDYWNSSSVCSHGGEVYGMVFVGDRLFLASYVGGDHMVYDPDEPWDQLNNVNPRTLRSVAPDLIRPEGRSVIGPDGCVWTGWSAKYGTYGGGLSRVDPATLEVDSWYDPIPERAVAGLAADDRHVYFTTHGGASGLASRKDIPNYLGVWKPGEGLVDRVEFAPGEEPGFAIAALGGLVAFGAGSRLRVYDPAARTFVRAIPLPDHCGWIVRLGGSRIGAFCGKRLLEIDVSNGESSLLAALPGTIRAATVTDAGDIYFSVKTSLYVLKSTAG